MMATTERTVQRTAHPHIVKIPGVCGGDAIIEGTRIAVWHIVNYYYTVKMSVEELLLNWNHLTPAQVFDALAYYHDNREEVDEARWQNSYERWKEQHASNAAQPAKVASE
jgi:uncharacterized protein (DUF433 family)